MANLTPVTTQYKKNRFHTLVESDIAHVNGCLQSAMGREAARGGSLLTSGGVNATFGQL